MSAQPTPVPAHLGAEFLLWLWWRSEQRGGRMELDAPVGIVDVWVDDRLAFKQPADGKATAVLTGEEPSRWPEARAALSGGKVLHDLRLGLRRDEREYLVTLRGPLLDVAGLKLPQLLSDGAEELVRDRMFLYEEVNLVIGGLFQAFGARRASSEWVSEDLPALRTWLATQG